LPAAVVVDLSGQSLPKIQQETKYDLPTHMMRKSGEGMEQTELHWSIRNIINASLPWKKVGTPSPSVPVALHSWLMSQKTI